MGRTIVTADKGIRDAINQAIASLVVADSPTLTQMAFLMGVSRTTMGEYIKGTTTPEQTRIEHLKDQYLTLVRMCDAILETYR